MGLVTSLGYGNYNALFLTYRMKEYHGVSLTSNFTWSRAMGTAVQSQASSGYTTLNPYNLQAGYGPNLFDIPLIFNVAAYYRPDIYKTQKGIIGHIVGGWTFSPLFFAQSGSPIGVGFSEGSCSSCAAFGEATAPASISAISENAVMASPYNGGTSANYNVAGSGGVGTNNPTGVNLYAYPAAVLAEFRKCVLGIDTSCGGYGNLRGLPTFNLDAQALKDIAVWKDGKAGATLSFQITNVLNHMQPSNPTLTLTTPSTFGRITGQSNTPRNMEFGLRIHF